MDGLFLNDEYIINLIQQHDSQLKERIPLSEEEEIKMQLKMNTLKQLVNDWILQMNLSYQHFSEYYAQIADRAVFLQDSALRIALLFLSQMSKVLGAGGILDENMMKVTKWGIDKILSLTREERKKEEFIEYCGRMSKIYSECQLNSPTFPGQLNQLKTILDNKFSARSNWISFKAILNTRFGEDIELYNNIKNILVDQGNIYLEGMFFSQSFFFQKQKNLGFGAHPVLMCTGRMGFDWKVNNKHIKNYFIGLLNHPDVDLFWKGTGWKLCEKCLHSKTQWLKERYVPLPSKKVCHKIPNGWKGCTVFAVKANILTKEDFF